MTDVLNDVMKATLIGKGYTGSMNEMLLEFYQDNGAVSDVFLQAEMQFLAARGISINPVPQMWNDFLRGLGYTGAVNEMTRAWFAADAPLS